MFHLSGFTSIFFLHIVCETNNLSGLFSTTKLCSVNDGLHQFIQCLFLFEIQYNPYAIFEVRSYPEKHMRNFNSNRQRSRRIGWIRLSGWATLKLNETPIIVDTDNHFLQQKQIHFTFYHASSMKCRWVAYLQRICFFKLGNLGAWRANIAMFIFETDNLIVQRWHINYCIKNKQPIPTEIRLCAKHTV